MPYESGMDPIHDTHRRFDVRFHMVAIAFLVFDVELLFLYPWAVASAQPTRHRRRWSSRGGGWVVAAAALVFGEVMSSWLCLTPASSTHGGKGCSNGR